MKALISCLHGSGVFVACIGALVASMGRAARRLRRAATTQNVEVPEPPIDAGPFRTPAVLGPATGSLRELLAYMHLPNLCATCGAPPDLIIDTQRTERRCVEVLFRCGCHAWTVTSA